MHKREKKKQLIPSTFFFFCNKVRKEKEHMISTIRQMRSLNVFFPHHIQDFLVVCPFYELWCSSVIWVIHWKDDCSHLGHIKKEEGGPWREKIESRAWKQIQTYSCFFLFLLFFSRLHNTKFHPFTF